MRSLRLSASIFIVFAVLLSIPFGMLFTRQLHGGNLAKDWPNLLFFPALYGVLLLLVCGNRVALGPESLQITRYFFFQRTILFRDLRAIDFITFFEKTLRLSFSSSTAASPATPMI